MNYYLLFDANEQQQQQLCKQQNYSMECHLLWHFIISYIVYFTLIISMSTIVICICILPAIILALLSCLYIAFYKGKLYNFYSYVTIIYDVIIVIYLHNMILSYKMTTWLMHIHWNIYWKQTLPIHSYTS